MLLETYDFSGKTVVLFATSGGSGFGRTVKELKGSVSDSATIKEGCLFKRTDWKSGT
ncbi:MAG: flavodoxin [Blautia sp.]